MTENDVHTPVSMNDSDLRAAEVQKTPNRVTLQHLESLITDKEFFNPHITPTSTVCVLKTKNGWTLVGHSAPADAGNFDAALGCQLAYEDALKKLWPLEGYLLRQQLAENGN